MTTMDDFIDQFMETNNIEYYYIEKLASYECICKFLCIHEDNNPGLYTLIKHLNISEVCFFSFRATNNTIDLKFCLGLINNRPCLFGIMYWREIGNEDEEGIIIDIFNNTSQEIKDIIKNKTNIELNSRLLSYL